MDVTTIWLMCTTLAFPIIGYFYNDLKKKVEKNSEDIMADKLHTSLHYVSKDELKQVVENMVRSVDNVAAGVLRIEARMNAQIDRRNQN